MKTALINASPKTKGSASAVVLQDVRSLLSDAAQIEQVGMHKSGVDGETMARLATCDAWVFAFGLYMDGVPSHLLRGLTVLERFFSRCPHRKITVYVLINCGFYEGEHARCALEIMKNWCVRAKLRWGQGIGIGAGGMLGALDKVPACKGPKKNLGAALKPLIGHMTRSVLADIPPAQNCYLTANIPRFAYLFAAELEWRQGIRANGLRREDLFRKI